MRNSLDAVADRDFALDYLYAAAVLFVHLRIGEEIVLWASSEFGFVRLPEAAATGSSMMPQKLNPDVAELARGKAGTQLGRLTGLLATLKALPLAYDRDLQEDKPPVFATRRDLRHALRALTVLVSGLEVDRERLSAAAADPLLRATDAAEALVREGVPFRDAYERVAASVREGSFDGPRALPDPLPARAASTRRFARHANASSRPCDSDGSRRRIRGEQRPRRFSMKRLLFAAAALLALAALAGVVGRTEGAGAADPPADRAVTVTGVGAARSVPDRAQLSFGVQTRAPTAQAALAANGTAMRTLPPRCARRASASFRPRPCRCGRTGATKAGSTDTSPRTPSAASSRSAGQAARSTLRSRRAPIRSTARR